MATTTTESYTLSLHDALPISFVPMRTLAQNDDLLSLRDRLHEAEGDAAERMQQIAREAYAQTESNLYAIDRKSTRLNSSHSSTSYAVFCLKNKIRESLLLLDC